MSFGDYQQWIPKRAICNSEVPRNLGSNYLNIRCKSSEHNMDDIKKNLKYEIIKIGMEIDYLLSQTNKCKEPLYIENLLCQLLI